MNDLIDTIQCGDATHLLKQLPDQCVDMIITSPPYYKQRDYNSSGLGIGQESTPEYYLETLMETFAQCVRVIKPTGNIVYNIGDKYQNGSLLLLPFRFAVLACQQSPVKLVNEITWIKRNPTPRQFNRRLVSSTEPFFHFASSTDYYYDRKNFCVTQNEPAYTKPTPKLGQKYRGLIDQCNNLTELQKQLAHQELDEVITEVNNER